MRRRRHREAGQSPVMAVLVLAAIAIVAAIFVTGRLAVATQDKAGAQHGADAAALAGAQFVLDEIPTEVAPGFLSPTDIPVLLGPGRCVQTGRAQAFQLASANGDQLTDYCYDPFTDEIDVTVSGDDGARAKATAATSFDAGSCTLDPGFTPPSEDPGAGDDSGKSSGDDKADAPPPPVQTLLDCGIANLAVTFNPVDSRFHFVDLGLALAAVQPRLTR